MVQENLLGYSSIAVGSSNIGHNNSVAIGYGAYARGNNSVAIGSSETTSIEIGGIDVLKIVQTVSDLQEQVKELQEQLEQLWYAPPGGGPGYQEGLERWTEAIMKQESKK